MPDDEWKKLEPKIKLLEELGKKYYIWGGWTINPNTPQEKHVPMRIRMGILKLLRCKICNEDLEQLRRDDPKRRAIKTCSHSCRIELKEIMKIKKKLKAVIIFWKPSKPPIKKNTIQYCLVQGEKWYNYKARKPKSTAE